MTLAASLLSLMAWTASCFASELVPAEAIVPGSPLSAVARLNNSDGQYCTAVLIASDLAVTAAHCLYNHRTGRWIDARAIHLLFAYDRGTYGFHVRGKSYEKGEFDYAKQQQTGSGDWAVLRLAESVPPQFAPLRQAASPARPDDAFWSAGFASPYKYRLQQVHGCSVLALANGYLLSRCAAAPGMSGGPLIDEKSSELIGIESGISSGKDGDLLAAIPVHAWREAVRQAD